MKYSNLSTNLKIIDWFKNNPSSLNEISEDQFHILEWTCLGYRGKDANKHLLITELISLGAELEKVNKNCFSYIVSNFLSLKKQPLNSDLVLLKISNSNRVSEFKEATDLLKLYTHNYQEDDFSEIKNKILFQNNTTIALNNLTHSFFESTLSNRSLINFYANIFYFSKQNSNILLSEIRINFYQDLLSTLKTKVPNIESCRDFLNQIEILENYKKLNLNLNFSKEPQKNIIKV